MQFNANRMLSTLLAALFAVTAVVTVTTPAHAQTVLTVTGPAAAKQGATVNLTISLSGNTATTPAGLQWTLVPPVGTTAQSVAATTAVTGAGKVVACGATNLLCLIYGPNQNIIPNGPIATITARLPANAAPGVTAFTLTGLIAGDKSGQPTAVSSGPAYNLTVLSISDINGDGTVNSADIAAMANQVTAGTCTDDQNGDSQCNLLDVLIVVLRSLGL